MELRRKEKMGLVIIGCRLRVKGKVVWFVIRILLFWLCLGDHLAMVGSGEW